MKLNSRTERSTNRFNRWLAKMRRKELRQFVDEDKLAEKQYTADFHKRKISLDTREKIDSEFESA